MTPRDATRRTRLSAQCNGDGAQDPGALHAVDEDLVGVLVELLHLLALDVDLAGKAQDIHQPGLVDLPGNDLGRQDEFV